MLKNFLRYEKSFSLWIWQQEEVEVEVEVEEMYIELQLGVVGPEVVIPAYAAERGQCSPGQGGPWPIFSEICKILKVKGIVNKDKGIYASCVWGSQA